MGAHPVEIEPAKCSACGWDGWWAPIYTWRCPKCGDTSPYTCHQELDAVRHIAPVAPDVEDDACRVCGATGSDGCQRNASDDRPCPFDPPAPPMPTNEMTTAELIEQAGGAKLSTIAAMLVARAVGAVIRSQYTWRCQKCGDTWRSYPTSWEKTGPGAWVDNEGNAMDGDEVAAAIIEDDNDIPF